MVCDGSDGGVVVFGDSKCNLAEHAVFHLNDNKLEVKKLAVGGSVDGIDPCVELLVKDSNYNINLADSNNKKSLELKIDIVGKKVRNIRTL